MILPQQSAPRWEVWHELYHGRFSLEEFVRIVHEELLFIRKDHSNDKKIVQVKYNELTAKVVPHCRKVDASFNGEP